VDLVGVALSIRRHSQSVYAQLLRFFPGEDRCAQAPDLWGGAGIARKQWAVSP